MIPKIIHYVWVGDKQKPKEVLNCINSWKKYCPDFEIREWGNKVLQNINNLYVSQAVHYKKWAFVSDYIRLYVLYNYGGFYLDTDCEITSPIDKFTQYSHVLGLEEYGDGIPRKIATSFWGCEKNDTDIKALLDEYENRKFIKENGELDLTANVHNLSKYMKNKYNFTIPYHTIPYHTIPYHTSLEEDVVYHFGENGVIFPAYYFCRLYKNYQNFAIHHFAYTWEGDFKRTLVLKIGKYKLVKFSQKKIPTTQLLPLSNEEIIIQLHCGKRYFCLVRYK